MEFVSEIQIDEDDEEGSISDTSRLNNTFKSLVSTASALKNENLFVLKGEDCGGSSIATAALTKSEIFAFVDNLDGSVIFELPRAPTVLDISILSPKLILIDKNEILIEITTPTTLEQHALLVRECEVKAVDNQKNGITHTTTYTCINNFTSALQVVSPPMLFVSTILDATRVCAAFRKDYGENYDLPYNSMRICFDVISSYTGCFVVALATGKVGAIIGGSAGFFIGGPSGAFAGAIIGSFVGKFSGALLGCVVGSAIGRNALQFFQKNYEKSKGEHFAECWMAESIDENVDENTAELILLLKEEFKAGFNQEQHHTMINEHLEMRRTKSAENIATNVKEAAEMLLRVLSDITYAVGSSLVFVVTTGKRKAVKGLRATILTLKKLKKMKKKKIF